MPSKTFTRAGQPCAPGTFQGIGLRCCALVVTLLAGCGGANGSSSTPPPAVAALTTTTPPQAPGNPNFSQIPGPAASSTPHSESRDPVPVTFHFALSAPSTQSRFRAKQDASYGAGYTSAAYTPTISLTVTPLGGSTGGPYTGPCTSGTSGNCTVSFTAAPGPTTFAGTISENGSVVARFSQTQVVQPNTSNTISFTASPVVASVSLQLAASTINAGTPQNVAVTVLAKDANNSTIAGSAAYVDSAGNPVAISLQALGFAAGGRGSIVLTGPTRIIGPAGLTNYARYDGNWFNRSVISATASSPLVSTTGSTVTLQTTPRVIEYSTGITGNPRGIITGPDRNIWFTEFQAHAIGKISLNGSVTTYACAACDHPGFMTNGPDGAIWISEDDGQFIDRLTLDGVITRVSALPGRGIHPVVGPDGNIWVASNTGTAVIKVSPRGSVSSFPAINNSRGIGFGSDGSMWLMASYDTRIARYTQTGRLIGTYSIPTTDDDSGGDILGPDGNMWFTNQAASQLHRITNAGVLTSFALQANAHPREMIVGPDGNLWWTENGTSSLGTMSTSASTPTEYGASVGISANADLIGLTVGPDGNIWFAESNPNRIAKFIL